MNIEAMRNGDCMQGAAVRPLSKDARPISEALRSERIEYGAMAALVSGSLVIALVVVGLAIAGRFDLFVAVL